MSTRLELHSPATVIVALVALAAHATAIEAQREADRDRWQRVSDVFAAMEIGEGSHVADVGAGDGYFTSRLADHVGSAGRVYAVDIDEGVLEGLRRRVVSDGLANVEVIEGAADDPRLPAGALDAVLVVNAYHEMGAYAAMLAGTYRALKPGGRLVILDFQPPDESTSRASQTARHTIALALVADELEEAGFEIARRDASFADSGSRRSRSQEWMLVGRRPLQPDR
jgi:ubiquinone/menaquinone biosynthesis C-methylase UbiE